MSKRLPLLNQLRGAQLHASDPAGHAALSASAGTGKTHVLTARVLRLLLGGADPGSILCLTFTKAGAAEMADRIHARLASWVRLADKHLRAELFALGESNGADELAHARTLFARVLDATGGGLRIQTIHAFSQSLLAAFPAEAGITPGFRPLDARAERLLARQVLADLLVRAEEGGDLPLTEDVRVLSRRLGEAGAEALLLEAARAPDAMEALGPPQGVAARLGAYFGVPTDLDEALVAGCGDACFGEALARVAAANRAWGAATGHDRAAVAEAFMAADPRDRVGQLADLARVWLTKSGDRLKVSPKLLGAEPDYHDHLAPLAETVARLLGMQQAAALVAVLAAGLRAGQAYARAYAHAKRAAGAVDFEDLIRGARDLLATPGMGEWVRYKLDQRTDHILVDEAQDTNAAQWSIVGELVEEFFQVDPDDNGAKVRTLFTVGDFKQAIFGFQGTEPKEFERARGYFERKADEAGQPFRNLSLDVSFRSSPPVLDLVNQLVRDIGAERLGLTADAPPHSSFHGARAGSVTLWKPYSVAAEADEEESEGEEGWINDATRGFATRLARQVRGWLDDPFFVHSKGRRLKPEDILILVRRRGELAGLLVARLHAEGVPVAGVDRLRLDAPLAVKDLLAAVRFAAQPLDDLNLANLLVSPLIGMTQDGLMAVAAARDGAALWSAVRDRAEPETTAALRSILAMADYTTPHEFLETLLSGPLDGRRKLVARLGEEARDPMEELVTAALEFEGATTGAAASLQSFIDWFERGEVEIVRDPASGGDAVRVMTVHGAKGLQAPVVILADATADPDKSPRGAIRVPLAGVGERVPLFRPRRSEMVAPLADLVTAIDERDRQEHWRLLYVAATRAEERLIIAGALGPACKGVPPKDSWFPALEAAMAALGAEPLEDPNWVWARQYEGRVAAPSAAPRERKRTPAPELAAPAWLLAPAPTEARPPRPLAPSSLGPDDAPDPPPGEAMRAAALRGSHLHALFERLPAVAPGERRKAGDAWLRGGAGVASARERAALLDDALRIIDDPAFADLFGPDALAEAPLTAVLADGTVVAGTVDRLLVTPTRVRVVDFKTGRTVPGSAEEIPGAYLRQMRAYQAALAVVFPGRDVEAALLFTAGPRLFAVDAG